jgi:cell division protein FtsW (lipid II flippase)
MQPQSYANHSRYVPMFHFVCLGILVATLIGSCVNLWKSWGDPHRFYSASLLVSLTFAVLIVWFFARIFALKAQDRAIRAEESLRHFAMTGKLPDARLTVRQLIGLRFASDEEFAALAKRAAEENLSEDQIKREVKNWRADHYRV